jgi:hypothetical protein
MKASKKGAFTYTLKLTEAELHSIVVSLHLGLRDEESSYGEVVESYGADILDEDEREDLRTKLIRLQDR